MNKLDLLKDRLKRYGRVAVAFSGGTDSIFLAAVAAVALAAKDVLLLHVRSVLLPPQDLGFAEKWSAAQGLALEVIPFDPFTEPGITDNGKRRCYYCKRKVFAMLLKVAQKRGFEVLADGANADDLRDYRPGMEAARELHVVHPLLEEGFCKRDIRLFAKELGLENAERPASACLASRIPTGTPLTRESLRMVDDAEQVLLGLGFVGVRVRLLGRLAKIEVQPEAMAEVVKARERIVIEFQSIGIEDVTLDLNGYRMGAMNAPQ